MVQLFTPVAIVLGRTVTTSLLSQRVNLFFLNKSNQLWTKFKNKWLLLLFIIECKRNTYPKVYKSAYRRQCSWWVLFKDVCSLGKLYNFSWSTELPEVWQRYSSLNSHIGSSICSSKILFFLYFICLRNSLQ